MYISNYFKAYLFISEIIISIFKTAFYIVSDFFPKAVP